MKTADASTDEFWASWDALRAREDHSEKAERRRKNRKAAWFAAEWSSYLLGAIIGTLVLQRVGVPAMTGAVIVLLGIIGLDSRWPELVKSSDQT